MKTLLSFCAAVIFIFYFFTAQTLTSCTKETTIRDTVIVDHFDTTIIYLHDTVQLTLESCCNENEGYVNSYYVDDNANGVNQLTVAAWTHDGAPEKSRSFIKFDYTDIPSNPVLISAKLSLYAIPTPGSGNMVSAHFGTANSFYIQRITTALNMDQVDWNNQPIFTTQNQVIVPQSGSAFQNNTDIDVTNLVKDMLANGNHGFFMQLLNETTFNSRQYCSSFYEEAAKRPKLVLQYKKQ